MTKITVGVLSRRRARIRIRGLRLHGLDGRDHEDGSIEHIKDSIHLGDEVRVAGRVHEVDADVVDDEGRDRGLDRKSTAWELQLRRISLSRTRVDAAELVDHSGGVEEPLGQSRLAPHLHGQGFPS